MFEQKISDRQHRKFSTACILIVLFIALLGYFFNFYPGGYSIQHESTERVTVIKHSLIKVEQFTFDVTRENELKVLLLKYNINQLISMWFVGLFAFSSLLIPLPYLYKNKLEEAFIMLLIFLIIILPLFIYILINHVNAIEEGITLLSAQ